MRSYTVKPAWLLHQPIRTVMTGSRAFTLSAHRSAPKICISLPSTINAPRLPYTVHTFKHQLKTHFFSFDLYRQPLAPLIQFIINYMSALKIYITHSGQMQMTFDA
jgi:hypothetical protein